MHSLNEFIFFDDNIHTLLIRGVNSVEILFPSVYTSLNTIDPFFKLLKSEEELFIPREF